MIFSDSQNINSISSNRFAQCTSAANFPEMSIALHFKEEIFEVAVGIWIAVCEINIILIIQKGVIPRESKKGFALRTIFTIAIFIVFDVLPSTVPT